MRTASIVIGVVVLMLFLLLAGSAGMMGLGGFGMSPGMMGGYGGYPGMMGGYGFHPIVGFLTVFFWGLIIGGIALVAVRMVRAENHSALHTASHEPPLEILKTRYARGEITKEQFESIRRDLEG